MQEAPPEHGETAEETLFRTWGFDGPELAAALETFRDPNGPRCDVVNMGTVALDVKYKGDFHTHPLMGKCALVDLQNRMPDGTEFEEPPDEDLQRAHAGGLGNDANAVARVLCNEPREENPIPMGTAETRHRVWEVMARMGRGNFEGGFDRVGAIYADKISDLIGKDLLQPDPVHRWSGLSRIWVQDRAIPDVVEEGERAIIFRAGASGATMLTKEDLLAIATRRPRNVNISYPGLFPEGMDRDNGVILSNYIRQLQKVCPIVSIDTHGPTELPHIEPSLSHIDMVNANLADAARIFSGRKIDSKREPEPEEKQELHREIFEKLLPHLTDSARKPKMFTVTDREGCFLIFQDRTGKRYRTYLKSPCAEIPAVDKTGAGDARYGFQRLYIARQMVKEWIDGSFEFEDAKRAVQIGQIATTLHVQGQEANVFQGVTLTRLEQVARAQQQYDSIASLRKALLHAT